VESTGGIGNGGGERIRTADPVVANDVLSQLSYAPVPHAASPWVVPRRGAPSVGILHGRVGARYFPPSVGAAPRTDWKSPASSIGIGKNVVVFRSDAISRIVCR
jgi:hypothetical protein